MIDARAARNDPDGFRRRLARKGAAEQFDELLAADTRWRVRQPLPRKEIPMTPLVGRYPPKRSSLELRTARA